MTSTSLLQRIRCRDQEAWQRFVGLYGPLVYGWCRRWGMQQSNAQDIVQEVFRAVAGGIDGFRKDGLGGTFRGWLWTIAKNKANTYFSPPRAASARRSVARTFWLGLPMSPSKFRMNRSARKQSLRHPASCARALDVVQCDFQERTWRAFLRTAMDGAGAVEVVAELKMTARAVRQAKHRVLQRLRDEFGDLID